LPKLKDYARSKILDGEAAQGKPAIDINKANESHNSWVDWPEQSHSENAEESAGDVNALASNLHCYICKKKKLRSIVHSEKTKAREIEHEVNTTAKAKVRQDPRARVTEKAPSQVDVGTGGVLTSKTIALTPANRLSWKLSKHFAYAAWLRKSILSSQLIVRWAS